MQLPALLSATMVTSSCLSPPSTWRGCLTSRTRRTVHSGSETFAAVYLARSCESSLGAAGSPGHVIG